IYLHIANLILKYSSFGIKPIIFQPKIIAKYGYPAEAHTVKTADGYLLTMHRIPHSNKGKPADGRPRPPIFLQHGLLGSSADWIVRGPHKALAYILSDSGYDVWMGNARGNTYSRSHMGYYDLPAEINHVLNVTNQTDLIYVGHSMGTTMFYVLASTRPEYTPKIRAMFSLAPVAFMARVKSPIRFLAPFAEDIDFVLNFLGDGEFLPQNKIIKFLSRYGCELATIEKEICENIIFAIVGFDSSQFNQALLPIVLGHFPAGSSTKTVLHYAQEIRSGKFQMYDYGAEKNMKRYGTSKAPEYDLNAIQVPISLHYSLNDWLANVDDVKLLYHRLPNTIGKYRVSLPQFNHLDFLWANDIEKLLFNNLLYLINKEAFRPGNSTDSRL
ncbi:hypothetical protein J437_LFUL009941, partial [Ladona fulva]